MAFLCRWFHKWETTGYNAYMIAIERKCERCGIYQHHKHEHIKGDPNGGFIVNWQEGNA